MQVVYVLKDSTNTPIYVGQSCDLERRLIEHKKWIEGDISIHALEVCATTEDALIVEQFYIAILGRMYTLLNTRGNAYGVRGPHSIQRNRPVEFVACAKSVIAENKARAKAYRVQAKILNKIRATERAQRAIAPNMSR